ncbi:MAG: tRNA (adenosine(37)-N6)-threonylcarbamoyltransferase complex dimerization subunit type 1 TsaB [Ginsengibacter sp.]
MSAVNQRLFFSFISMTYLLNIHTATEEAMVNICDGKKVLATLYNNDPKQHGAFLHKAIKEILAGQKITPKNLSAVGVTNGPGSYTGIRVGLASAKGLCYALGIPLLTFNTLHVMARTLISEINDPNAFYGPMIDARRMEVFTAVFDFRLNEVIAPASMILDNTSFANIVDNNKIFFSGSGSLKFKNMDVKLNAAFYPEISISSVALAICAESMFLKGQFNDVAYSQAVYLKEFYFPKKEII